jgi:release factor glutamine methyltransferase
MTTVASLLRAYPLAPLDARILLAHALGWRRTELITRSEQSPDAAALARFHALAQRRVAGEPVAQLIGEREFFGLPFIVTPDVLIPRPETELLVELALQAIEGVATPRVLDLGTGTGAIAIAIAHARPDAVVRATDRSSAALAVAARNAAHLLADTRPGGALRLLAGDWYEALAGDAEERFQVIVSNPPYIAKDDPHLALGDLRFEPRAALTDDADGLSAVRTIIDGAPAWLAPDGALWLEHGYDQAARVRALLSAQGFMQVRSQADLAAIERASGGTRPARPEAIAASHAD